MHSREQYLERVREEYRKASKKAKTRLLNEARKRTGLNRKVVIGKLAHPPEAKAEKKRRARKCAYGSDTLAALVSVWEIFDYPCGQRLAPALGQEVERLRRSKELRCSDEVAAQLQEISAKTIDRLLAREKRVRCLRQNRNPSVHPLLYQKIPVKVASEWDLEEVGNVQLDHVAHCGRSTAGELSSATTVDESRWLENAGCDGATGRRMRRSQSGSVGLRWGWPGRMDVAAVSCR